MPRRQEVTAATLQDQKVFIKDHIKVKASCCCRENPFTRWNCFQVFLYWLYLVTLGRCLEPAKYHLFQLAVKEIRERHELNSNES